MTQLITVDAPAPRPRLERIQVYDAVPLMDTGRFEQMYRIAKVMASSSLLPESLCSVTEGSGPDRKKAWLPVDTVAANCFQLVNQAMGWGMDPFAVAQCASFVHGKVCYEGKLVAAVIEQKLGIRLSYRWNDKAGDAFGITVSGRFEDEPEAREVEGTVGEWKTTGNGSPWLKQPKTQLAYRGARQWARLHSPAIILGVYTIDEMEGALDRQARLPPSRTMSDGAAEMRGWTSPAQTQTKLTPPDPSEPPKQAKPSDPAASAPRLPPDPDKAAGGPPKPQETTMPKEPTKPAAEFDFDAFRAQLAAAATLDAVNAIYDLEATNRYPALTAEALDECDAILREACARFWQDEPK